MTSSARQPPNRGSNPFIEDGDEDLDVVRKRFDQAQDTVKRELRRQHVRVALRVRAGKTLTTALEDLKP